MPSGALDIGQQALLLVQCGLAQHFQKQPLGVDGLAQVVAGGGQEFRFGDIGLLCLLLGARVGGCRRSRSTSSRFSKRSSMEPLAACALLRACISKVARYMMAASPSAFSARHPIAWT
jgi:hypothetical protein